jgi:hypothetical protein
MFTFKGTELSEINISNSSFTMIDVTLSEFVYGGVLYIETCGSFKVIGCVFENILVSGCGGVLYIGSCMDIYITSTPITDAYSIFKSIVTNGSGGSLYFGSGTFYSLNKVRFENCMCTSSNSYGGAIYSESMIPGFRVLTNVIFIENSVPSNKGNDLCDNSVDGINYYGKTQFSGTTSTSASYKLYVLYIDVPLDCLLANEACPIKEYYVSFSTGKDYLYCGLEELPCKTIEYTISISPVESNLFVMFDEYFTTQFLLAGTASTINNYEIKGLLNELVQFPSVEATHTLVVSAWLKLDYTSLNISDLKILHKKCEMKWSKIESSFPLILVQKDSTVRVLNVIFCAEEDGDNPFFIVDGSGGARSVQLEIDECHFDEIKTDKAPLIYDIGKSVVRLDYSYFTNDDISSWTYGIIYSTGDNYQKYNVSINNTQIR